MITILADRHGFTSPPADTLLAVSVADYVPVRQHIRSALDQHTDLTVYVSDPVVLLWLGDLQQYPPRVVCWRTIDPCEEFTEFFGVAPVSPFTPELIVALHLNALTRPPQGAAVDPIAWILGEQLGDLWRYITPPAGHAAQLAAWATGRDLSLPEELLPLIAAQLDRWERANPLYRALRARHLREDASALLARSALQRYDARWHQSLPWGHLPLLDVADQELACISILREYSGLIATYWRQRFAQTNQSPDLIAVALNQMSGLSETELTELSVMLDRHPALLDPTLLAAIRHRFDKLPSAVATLRELQARVAPVRPALPELKWSDAQWLRWATQSYLPYFAWTIRTGQERDHQQACADHFSDWLYERYPSWLNDEQSPLLLNQYRQMRTLLSDQPNAVVVWLVVDGLTWWQGTLLREACERQGLHTQALAAGIAALPSITSVSKRALVTGLPTVDLTQPIIAEAARAQLHRGGIIGHVGYSMSEALNVLQQNSETRCFIVLFNMIDVLAHQTPSFTDNAGIRGYLDELARDLGRMRDACIQQGRPFHVLIGSDHGSTLLPAHATGLPLPQATQEIDDTWEPETPDRQTQKPSTRAAVISDPARIAPADRAQWYGLERDRYQLDRHYLAPRGYNYVGRRPGGWTHGGLTPEEVIVSLLHLTPEKLDLQPLTLELVGTLRAQQASTITAVIVNPNRFPIDDITLDLNGGPLPVHLDRVAPLTRCEAHIEFPAIIGPMAELLIQWRMHYHVVGVAQAQEGRMALPIRRLQTEDTSFDDLFADD